jgi:5'(3')-deoxyribonucleotidase
MSSTPTQVTIVFTGTDSDHHPPSLYQVHLRSSVRQTVEWLEEHGIPYWDICFMKSKGDVGADFYIEDSPNNIKALQAGGKDVLIFDNSTNPEVPGERARSWEEVEQFVLKKVEEWKKNNS